MAADKRNAFTLVRLIAASLVIITHTYVVLGMDQGDIFERNGFIGLSKIGVDAFFVISGYLVTLSMKRSDSLTNFLFKRSMRIMPGLCVSLLITILLFGYLATNSDHYILNRETWKYMYNALLFNMHPYLPGVFKSNHIDVVNGSLWTLPLEVICYASIMLLSWSKAFNWRLLLILMVLMLTLHMHDTFSKDKDVLTVPALFLNELGYLFFYGSLLAHLKDRIIISWYITVPLVALIIWSSFHNHGDWHFSAGFYLVLWPYCLISICTLFKSAHILNKFDYSYGIYIYGFVIQQSIVHFIPGLTSIYYFAFLSLMLSSIAGAISWHFVESPVIKITNGYRVGNKTLQIN